MKRYKVSISEPAEDDLDDIIEYILTKLSAPAAALNLADAFEKAFDDLEEMPEKHPLVRDDRLAAMGYRRCRVKNYSVFFTVNNATLEVDVERILYSRRDWANIL